jgi:hypothetical protein
MAHDTQPIATARQRRLGLARNSLLAIAVGALLIGSTIEGRYLDPPTAPVGNRTHRQDIKGRVVYLTDLQNVLYLSTPTIFMMSLAGAIVCDLSRWWLRRRRG